MKSPFPSPTLTRYLGRHFMMSVAAVFAIFACLFFLIDFLELLRRTSGRDDIGFLRVFGMALLKLPSLAEQAFPFVILMAAMASLTRLTRSHELVVVRMTGISVWQFLAPFLALSFVMGTVMVTVYNPIAAAMVSRYEQIDATVIRRKTSVLALSDTGVWLRQADANGRAVVHAGKVNESDLSLQDVVIFSYDAAGIFTSRVDAKSAILRDGYWMLTDAWVTDQESETVFNQSWQLPTSLTPDQVRESFTEPESISFWQLERFIQLSEAAGFSTLRYRIHFNGLLATPILLCAMVLLAAVFSFRHARFGGIVWMITGGILSGFALYFVSNVALALGESGAIPVFLAAWGPAILVLCIVLIVLLRMEDG